MKANCLAQGNVVGYMSKLLSAWQTGTWTDDKFGISGPSSAPSPNWRKAQTLALSCLSGVIDPGEFHHLGLPTGIFITSFPL